MNTVKKQDAVDMNRDPITGTPGSHPVGTGVGAAGGGIAGAAAGAFFGPIGMLVGGTIGTIAGAAAGKGVAEQIDPTGELDYWRGEHGKRPYIKAGSNYDKDYAPAYRYGVELRNSMTNRPWDESLESEIGRDWSNRSSGSSLAWDDARPAVRDAWDRTDRSHRAYENSDRYYQTRYAQADYADRQYGYEDYRSAYRYGMHARSNQPGRQWDSALESDLESGWDRAKGNSRLSWDKAKAATRDAWHSFERALPGDADNDGR